MQHFQRLFSVEYGYNVCMLRGCIVCETFVTVTLTRAVVTLHVVLLEVNSVCNIHTGTTVQQPGPF